MYTLFEHKGEEKQYIHLCEYMERNKQRKFHDANFQRIGWKLLYDLSSISYTLDVDTYYAFELEVLERRLQKRKILIKLNQTSECKIMKKQWW